MADQTEPERQTNPILTAGTPAPDFELQFSPGHVMSLSEWRGRPLILVFYPADFSPVCGDQMSLYNEVMPEFADYDAQLIGISVDGPWCHAAFAQARKLRFPLLSDFEPKGEVSRRYGAYEEGEGVSARALFVIDDDGVIRWSELSPENVNPGADGILNALEQMVPRKSDTGARHVAERSHESRP